jgi:membrane-bound metal-dependent hydrolase YbcI (DUF457 family)
MDTITHGIAGALIGKAFFSDRWGPAATVAATVGAVFPDCDAIAEAFSHNSVALLKYHRGITHSFVAMPFFALALGALIWWLARRRGIRALFWPLVLATLAGIASHILLDGLTSFGTRMWDPISWTRVSWDWLFIVDPTLTTLLLVPQVAAWVQRDREKAPWRALGMWGLFTILASITWGAEWAVGARVPFEIVPVAGAVLAAVFFLPLVSGRFFEWSRQGWCMAGLALAIVYIGICGVEHHRALEQVRAFARSQPEPIDAMAAIPMPPSPIAWNGLIRTPSGVYSGRIDSLDDGDPARFVFLRDSPDNGYVERAFHLSSVRTYLAFARFPLVRYDRAGRDNYVYFYDLRFFLLQPGPGRRPFTYRVVFGPDGQVLHQGWWAPVGLRGFRGFRGIRGIR